MRARVSCHTVHAYDPPARSVTQVLRLTPRNQDSQRVVNWRIDVDVDCILRASEDAFGNITHVFSAPGPLSQMIVSVDGEVETFDVAGVARGAIERFPPELYLRPTPLTQAGDALRAFAAGVAASDPTPLGRLHALMDAVGERMTLVGEPSGQTAEEVFARGRGACDDFAHVFIASARAMDIPARCVSGLFVGIEDVSEPNALHAWVEAHVDGLGWVGFDAVHCICPREAHLCLARGLDYLGAAPIRGANSGGGEPILKVELRASRAEGYSRY